MPSKASHYRSRRFLIGMPGIEKRLARYPQFYSRIGFIHEFRQLGVEEIRRLLAQPWVPSGVKLPSQPWPDDAIAAIIRITSGNFRLLNRLLTQMERILEINGIQYDSEGRTGLRFPVPLDRHRGGGHPPTPATPPCVRVRTRRFESVTSTFFEQ